MRSFVWKEAMIMDDEKILDLYFARSEKAISETELKYGRQVWRVQMAF